MSVFGAAGPRRWVVPLLVFVAALLLYLLNLDRPPHPDELHHVLAGQHLLEDGRPIIAEGEYSRGILYTWLVALSYQVFGDSLASARIPAAFLVALVAPILFIWVRREAGRLAAGLATLLFVTSPFVVEIAQFARFYSLQMIFFTSGAICVYYGVSSAGTPIRRSLLLLMSAVLLAMSVWVQDTTFIGLVGIGAWIAGTALFQAFRNASSRQATIRCLVLLAALAVVAVLAAIFLSDHLAWAWRRYRTASLFAADSTDEFWYYHLRYVLFYPTLWPMVGVLAICAAARNSRLAWFAATVFAVSFLLTSFAAQKATRYFSYAQPLLAVIWGVGLGQSLPWLWRQTESGRQQLANSFAIPIQARPALCRALIVLSVAFACLMNPFWLRSASIIGNVALPGETPATDWRAARAALEPWTSNAEIMITTEELGAIYFLGRSDVRYSPSKIQELPREQRVEFGIDPRTGRPIITKPRTVEELVGCFDSGFVVGPVEHWGSPILIDKDVQDVLRRYATPIAVPRDSHLYAWGWKRPRGGSRPAYCAELQRFSGLGRH